MSETGADPETVHLSNKKRALSVASSIGGFGSSDFPAGPMVIKRSERLMFRLLDLNGTIRRRASEARPSPLTLTVVAGQSRRVEMEWSGSGFAISALVYQH